ncbi:HTH 38 domain containing protein [Asbolus verrucosus]|uniref:HTH 38 domain containing protein n=1 Tax=Asbolus verrucosus TaxID=1661398 RepID=A0A482W693_ASBVE|nr:HTH 38 domain containing protein [Asbolus verrucosus]
MHEAGLGHREIARRLGHTHSTILKTCRGWQEEQLQTRRRGTGRPRSSQEREDRLLRRSVIQDPWEPSRSAGINWIRAIGHRIAELIADRTCLEYDAPKTASSRSPSKYCRGIATTASYPSMQ